MGFAEDLWERAKQQWHEARRVSAVLILVAIVAGGGTWKVASLYYEQRIATADERMKLADERIANNKALAPDQTPPPPPEGFAPKDALRPDYLRGLTLRLTDVLTNSNIIRGKTFVNCEIYGPAVVELRANVRIQGNMFAASGSIFWPLPPNDAQRSGAVIVEDVAFLTSRFYGVAFTGDEKMIERLRHGIEMSQ